MNVLSLFKPVTTFVFDVDGVLTDGTIYLLENGLQARRMHTKDGFALQLAVKKGYRVLVISGAVSVPVIERLQKLGIHDVHMGVQDKAALLKQYMAQHQLPTEQVLCMGDDIPDMGILKMAGLACCPSDAVMEIKSMAQYISPFAGGQTCVRDVLEKVLRLNDHWQSDHTVTSR